MTLLKDAPKRVLIIEDEEALRVNMVRGLSKLPGIEVFGAGTVGEGLEIVDQRAPDLLISDIDLPDRLGLEMIGELRSRGLSTLIIFISGYLKAYQPQIPPNGGVEVHGKPMGIDQLRSLVLEKLSVQPAARSAMGVPDYLHLAALGGHSVELEIQSHEVHGLIIVNRGEPWAAEDEIGDGRDAFWRLAYAQDCTVTCTALKGDPGPRILNDTLMSLLKETRDGVENPTPELTALSKVDIEFNRLMDTGIEQTIQKNYTDALDTFQRALILRPEDRRVEANIQRLNQLLSPS